VAQRSAGRPRKNTLTVRWPRTAARRRCLSTSAGSGYSLRSSLTRSSSLSLRKTIRMESQHASGRCNAARLRSRAIRSNDARLSLVTPTIVALEASASRWTKCWPWSTYPVVALCRCTSGSGTLLPELTASFGKTETVPVGPGPALLPAAPCLTSSTKPRMKRAKLAIASCRARRNWASVLYPDLFRARSSNSPALFVTLFCESPKKRSPTSCASCSFSAAQAAMASRNKYLSWEIRLAARSCLIVPYSVASRCSTGVCTGLWLCELTSSRSMPR